MDTTKNNKLDIHFSSEKDYWETPQDLFDELHNEFGFDLDVACSRDNCKCTSGLFVEQFNSLTENWNHYGDTCWMNPPYGRQIGKWIKKAYEESQKGVTVVCLIPNRPTKAWFNYIYERTENGKYPYGAKTREGVEVRALEKRVVFEIGGEPMLDKDGKPMPAPFPSAVIIFRG